MYSRGLRAQDLTFGSLYLDPANPLEGERKHFNSELQYVAYSAFCEQNPLSSADYNHSLQDVEGWVTEQLDEPCSLTFTASHEWALIAGALLFSVQGGRSHSGEVTISGASGRRYQINRLVTMFPSIMRTNFNSEANRGEQTRNLP